MFRNLRKLRRNEAYALLLKRKKFHLLPIVITSNCILIISENLLTVQSHFKKLFPLYADNYEIREELNAVYKIGIVNIKEVK